MFVYVNGHISYQCYLDIQVELRFTKQWLL